MNSIYNYTISDLSNSDSEFKIKQFQAKQIFQWLYQKRVTSYDDMTNISKKNREILSQNFELNEIKLLDKMVASDGTVKYLFELYDGNVVETVLMPQNYGNSICVSSQVGCNMGCVFCASGELKKVRNLSVSEMVLQVLQIQKDLDKKSLRVSHVVIMGIGEPFDNFDNVIKFIQIINDPFGLAIGARHITVSTCGLVNRIDDFADLPLQVNLAISLHAANDEKRKKLMPIANRYSIEQLFSALDAYYLKTKRRITIEYILLKDVNDSIADARQLVTLLRTRNVYVNLIPYNQVDGNQYKTSTKDNTNKFFNQLKINNIQCTIRKEFGSDIDGACGQLRVHSMKVGK